MKVQILNLYSNEKESGSRLKNAHGQSFLISIGDEQILFDLGQKSHLLLHNMAELNIPPDDITKLVLSHGHRDHTGGLPGFLDKRIKKETLPLFAHPDFREEKIAKISFIKMPLGCPDLYLNHCTDKLPIPFIKKTKTIDILKKRFGPEKVKNCYVGTKITFECD